MRKCKQRKAAISNAGTLSRVANYPRSVSMLVEEFTNKQNNIATESPASSNAGTLSSHGLSQPPPKKVKDGHHDFNPSPSTQPVEKDPKQDSRSYKSMVLGSSLQQEIDMDSSDQLTTSDSLYEDVTGLSVIEQLHGKYECPAFWLIEQEEERIQQPCKDGLIVKLLW